MTRDLDDIVARLESIAEELSDMAIESLREAIERGSDRSDERVLTRARRSVEKAALLLSREGQRSEGRS